MEKIKFKFRFSWSKVFLLILFFIGLYGCKGKPENQTSLVNKYQGIEVFDFDNKEEFNEYIELNLDDTHPNLLNPKISKSDYNEVVNSWTDLHYRLGKFLSESQFDWEVNDPKITILQKIYFKPDGEIESYFFNVLNKNVTEEKRERFSDLVSEFARNNRIEFESDEKFVQCGKTQYLN